MDDIPHFDMPLDFLGEHDDGGAAGPFFQDQDLEGDEAAAFAGAIPRKAHKKQVQQIR